MWLSHTDKLYVSCHYNWGLPSSFLNLLSAQHCSCYIISTACQHHHPITPPGQSQGSWVPGSVSFLPLQPCRVSFRTIRGSPPASSALPRGPQYYWGRVSSTALPLHFYQSVPTAQGCSSLHSSLCNLIDIDFVSKKSLFTVCVKLMYYLLHSRLFHGLNG